MKDEKDCPECGKKMIPKGIWSLGEHPPLYWKCPKCDETITGVENEK